MPLAFCRRHGKTKLEWQDRYEDQQKCLWSFSLRLKICFWFEWIIFEFCLFTSNCLLLGATLIWHCCNNNSAWGHFCFQIFIYAYNNAYNCVNAKFKLWSRRTWECKLGRKNAYNFHGQHIKIVDRNKNVQVWLKSSNWASNGFSPLTWWVNDIYK